MIIWRASGRRSVAIWKSSRQRNMAFALILGVSAIVLTQVKFRFVHRLELQFSSSQPDSFRRLEKWLSEQDGVDYVGFYGNPNRKVFLVTVAQYRTLFQHSVGNDIVRACEAADIVNPKIISTGKMV
jgi:hypothetical protein